MSSDIMADEKEPFSRDFNDPDDTLDFGSHGCLEVQKFNDDLIVGHHFGYCLSGTMAVRMDNGEECRIRAGEAFHLLPGHDVWVEGNERCEVIDFSGARLRTKQAKSRAA